ACLRSGAGLLTVHAPQCALIPLQSSVPEAMAKADVNETMITSVRLPDHISAIGVGCGIGTSTETQIAIMQVIKESKLPVVIDADAINILSKQPGRKNIPANAILTPHLKEFERLAGPSSNDFDRHEKQKQFSKEHQVYIILKGAHSCITCPDGTVYFNNTGNPGMAKGGTGDALTGILLALLAQGYSPDESCKLGIYVHGFAGDLASHKHSEQSVLATDLIDNLGEAFGALS